MLERLTRHVDALEGVDQIGAEHLLDGLRSDRERAVVQLLAAFRSERYDAVLDHLVVAAQRPRLLLRVDDEDDRDVLRAIARRPWEQLERAVSALPDDPTDTALHEIRIKVKRARYAAEAVEPAIGKAARTYAKALVALQDILGENQDAVVAVEWLRRAAATATDGGAAFSAGVLAAREVDAFERTRDEWRGAWENVDRKRVRGWL
jgi:CHAD domain-containing protein